MSEVVDGTAKLLNCIRLCTEILNLVSGPLHSNSSEESTFDKLVKELTPDLLGQHPDTEAISALFANIKKSVPTNPEVTITPTDLLDVLENLQVPTDALAYLREPIPDYDRMKKAKRVVEEHLPSVPGQWVPLVTKFVEGIQSLIDKLEGSRNGAGQVQLLKMIIELVWNNVHQLTKTQSPQSLMESHEDAKRQAEEQLDKIKAEYENVEEISPATLKLRNDYIAQYLKLRQINYGRLEALKMVAEENSKFCQLQSNKSQAKEETEKIIKEKDEDISLCENDLYALDQTKINLFNEFNNEGKRLEAELMESKRKEEELELRGRRNLALFHAICIDERGRNQSLNEERARQHKLNVELDRLSALKKEKEKQIEERATALQAKKKDNDNFIQATYLIQKLSLSMLEEVQNSVSKRVEMQKERTKKVFSDHYDTFKANWILVENEIHRLTLSIRDAKSSIEEKIIEKKRAQRLQRLALYNRLKQEEEELINEVKEKEEERLELGKISEGLEREFVDIKTQLLDLGLGTLEDNNGQQTVVLTLEGEGDLAIKRLVHPRPDLELKWAQEDMEFEAEVFEHLEKRRQEQQNIIEGKRKLLEESQILAITGDMSASSASFSS